MICCLSLSDLLCLIRSSVSPSEEPYFKCSINSVVNSYSLVRCRYRIFPSLQKVLLNGVVLEVANGTFFVDQQVCPGDLSRDENKNGYGL